MSEVSPTRRASGDPVRGGRAGGAREVRLERLAALLHGAGGLGDDPDARTWAVLDGASVQGLVRAIESGEVESECLLPGQLDLSMERVAPRLVVVEPGGAFEQWVLGRGWRRHWGIFLRSTAGRLELRQHLRGLLSVLDPEGRVVFFRYYDPRVLREYLPTCTSEEAAQVFGPVAAFVAERADGDAEVFTRGEDGRVAQTTVPVQG